MTNRANGLGTITPQGYLRRLVGERRVMDHVLVAERALGRPLPNGVVVHHVDEDRTNNAPDNLIICTRAYHAIIHQRMRAKAACGNPDWRRCSICKQYDDPARLYVDRTSAYHLPCHNQRRRRRTTKE